MSEGRNGLAPSSESEYGKEENQFTIYCICIIKNTYIKFHLSFEFYNFNEGSFVDVTMNLYS